MSDRKHKYLIVGTLATVAVVVVGIGVALIATRT